MWISRNKDVAGTAHQGAGFTLIEIMVAVSIMLLLGMLTIPSMSRMLRGSKMRDRTANVESVVHRTIAAAVAKGAPARLVIEGDVIRGELAEDGTNYAQITDVTFDINDHQAAGRYTFTRSLAVPTPWLESEELLSLFAADEGDGRVLEFSRLGVPAQGCTLFLEDTSVDVDSRASVAIEILATGAIKTYHLEDGTWTR